MKLTVADLDARGADSVTATCGACGREWRAMVRFLPPKVTLAHVSGLLECRACGGQNVSVSPIWKSTMPAAH